MTTESFATTTAPVPNNRLIPHSGRVEDGGDPTTKAPQHNLSIDDMARSVPSQRYGNAEGNSEREGNEAEWDHDTNDWAYHASRRAAELALSKNRHRSRTRPGRVKSRKLGSKALRSRLPAITVDTSVAQHCGPLPVSLHKRKHSKFSRGENNKPVNGFVGLADLLALDTGAKHTIDTWWPRKKSHHVRGESSVDESRTTMDEPARSNVVDDSDFRARSMKHKAKGLVPPPIRLGEELSPCDRPIVIGLSIPSAALTGYSPDTQAASAGLNTPAQRVISHGRSPSEANSVTPTILITPAKEPGWSPLASEAVQASRPRARSSVYSQPSPTILNQVAEDAPPMPHIASNIDVGVDEKNPFTNEANFRRDSAATLFEEDESPDTRARIVSTSTAFEEDESLSSMVPVRSASTASDGRSDNRIASSPTATRHQSLGWWNILTPFLPRSSNMTLARGDPDIERPSLPSPSNTFANSLMNLARTRSSHPKALSPTSPVFKKSKRGHTTVFTDMTDWEEQLGQGVFGAADGQLDIPTDQRHSFLEEKSRHSQCSLFDSGSTGSGEPALQKLDVLTEGTRKGSPFQQQPREVLKLETRDVPRVDHNTASSHERTMSSDHFSPNDREVPMLFDATTPVAVRTQVPNPFAHLETVSEKEKTSYFKMTRERCKSEATEFELDISPTVRQANVVPIVRPEGQIRSERSFPPERVVLERPVQTRPDTQSPQPPPYSPPRNRTRKYGAILPPGHLANSQARTNSPNSVTPSLHQTMSSRGAYQMSEVPPRDGNPPQFTQAHQTATTGAGTLPPRPRLFPVTIRDLDEPARSSRSKEQKRKRGEKEDAIARRFGALWRGRGCFSTKARLAKGGSEVRKRRRWLIGLSLGLVTMIIVILVLAITLTRKSGAGTGTESMWLNVTGWPPVPTKMSTIVQPDAVEADTSCVFPSTMWSCAVPKELQQTEAVDFPDQPTFKVLIRYRNVTTAGSPEPNSTTNKTRRSRVSNPASAGKFIRRQMLEERAADPDPLWIPSPPAPNVEEQRFMGITTDDIAASLKEGELSPFYITLLSPSSSSSSIVTKRQAPSSDADEESVQFPEASVIIPPPASDSDGTASPANLLPLPEAQPLRLFDRGLDTEHFGFYNYFDRAIFLRSTSLLNQLDLDRGEVPADQNGGSNLEEARVRCTWAQTRFLVQIWTNKPQQRLLLSGDANNATTTNTAVSESVRPGSFPYPVTVTLDRHGGDVEKKMIYCYGVDERSSIIREQAKIQVENRGFGGDLVGGGQGPLGKGKVSLAQGGLGGIDGGTGGCRCRWRNFADTAD
ncbi:MAG: hypothetical protein M1833_004350 [Piccolia ochrophora]|nr:MAG: hypothetical protein M1833_004350 [Piccolia ochrophora]